MTTNTYDLSLVIACYNEEAYLIDHFHQILQAMEETRWTFEFIFVDDKSDDSTRRIIEAIIEEHPHVPIRRIYHTHNRGRGRTVSDGIQTAHGEIVGYIAIDLEVQIQNILAMIVALKNGADVVLADRIYKLQPTNLHRHILSVGYRWLRNWILGLPLGDTEAGYKFFKRDRILPIVAVCEDPGWFWDTEIIVRAHLAGQNIAQLPCLYIRHPSKKSTVRIVPDTLDYLAKLIRFRGTLKQLRKSGTNLPGSGH